MKKFKIIEEGRLDASKLSQIKGGGLTCRPIYHQGDGPDDPSTCPDFYRSCAGSLGKLVCNLAAGYSGPAGPAGLVSEAMDLIY